MTKKSPPAVRLKITGPRHAAGPVRETETDSQLVRVRSPFAWLRPVLLVLGFLVIGAVVLMLAAYRFGRGTLPQEETAETAPATPDLGERVVSGQGFDYTQTSEGEPVFRIRADQSQQDRDGTSYLTTVTLELFRENDDSFTVESKNARVNENTWDMRVEGDVVLRGWENLELQARALELRHGGQVLVSVGAVELRYPPDFAGRASALQVDRQTGVVTLSGGVHLHTVPGAKQPLRLDCERLVYQREGGVLRAVGEAKLRTESQTLAAHYLTLFLAEDGRTMEAARARWNVVGTASPTNDLGETTEIVYRGQFVDVQPDPRRPEVQRIKLDGEGEPVKLEVTTADGSYRSFTGLWVNGQTKDGQLTQIEAVGEPMVFLEGLATSRAPHPLRQLCAERMTARFLPSGDLSRVQLEKRVELNENGITLAGGETASLNAEDGLFRIAGDAVQLLHERSEVVAPQLTWARRTGLIRAYGGVLAVLAEEATRQLTSTPLAQGQGPVQVEAEEAYWTTDPPTFQFDGEVRAWRDQSLILADQLRGDERQKALSASGAVRTVWVPGRDGTATATPPGATPAATTPADDPRPIEVSAERMTYLDEAHQLVYSDGVELLQGQRRLSCRELTVDLLASGRAERMTCVEGVELNDPESGRRASGEKAIYTLATELVEIFGESVEVVDLDGKTRGRGRYVVYDLKDHTFKFKSDRPEGPGAVLP